MNQPAVAQFVQDTDFDEAFMQEWTCILAKLSQKFGDATFKSWIEPLRPISFNSGTLVLSIPTRFMRDWVKSNYLNEISIVARDINAKIFSVDVIVNSDLPVAPAQTPATIETPFQEPIKDGFCGTLEDITAPLDPRYTFDDYIVGKTNELAYAAARRVAEAETVTFNPLFLYGGVGLGKTHLMHAIAWHIKKSHPKRKVLYLTAEKFMYQFIRALRFKDTVVFKEQFRSVDVLMIDDVQFISGKDSTQEEFFHTFNALVDRNHQVIISADKSPSDLEGMEERLKSRLGWGLVADIHPTTYELRLGILQAKAEQLAQQVPDQVFEFLARRITSNVRELEGALNRVVAHSTLVGREITLELTQDVLRDLIRANDRRITIEDVQKKVAEHFNIRMTDMHSAKRTRTVARPRQIAMFLSKTLTGKSLPEIGRQFGGRDHTTVMHAIKKIEELVQSDISISEDVELLRRMMQI